MNDQRLGFWAGAAAYLSWGFFPLYWPLLKPAGAVEVLAHRMTWSLVFVVALLVATRKAGFIRPLLRDRARLAKTATAAVFISVNWGLYIWGVNHHHVVETSLGYFINPLILILVGVVVLSERLRAAQWAAVGLGVLAVATLTVAYGRVPWLALALASSFTVYGYLKKTVKLPAAESLAAETTMMFLPALGYLVYLAWTGEGTFGRGSAGHSLLLAAAGPVTAIPLLCFGASATRVPLSTLGMLQFTTPVTQFVIGVWVDHEAMPASRWAGFSLVWAALAVLTWDVVRQARANRRAVSETQSLPAARQVAAEPEPSH